MLSVNYYEPLCLTTVSNTGTWDTSANEVRVSSAQEAAISQGEWAQMAVCGWKPIFTQANSIALTKWASFETAWPRVDPP